MFRTTSNKSEGSESFGSGDADMLIKLQFMIDGDTKVADGLNTLQDILAHRLFEVDSGLVRLKEMYLHFLVFSSIPFWMHHSWILLISAWTEQQSRRDEIVL